MTGRKKKGLLKITGLCAKVAEPKGSHPPPRTDALLFFISLFIELFLGLIRVCRRVPLFGSLCSLAMIIVNLYLAVAPSNLCLYPVPSHELSDCVKHGWEVF